MLILVCVLAGVFPVLVPQVEDIMKREGVSFDDAKVRMVSPYMGIEDGFTLYGY